MVRARCNVPSVTGSPCGGEETVLSPWGSMGWTGTGMGQGHLRCGHAPGWLVPQRPLSCFLPLLLPATALPRPVQSPPSITGDWPPCPQPPSLQHHQYSLPRIGPEEGDQTPQGGPREDTAFVPIHPLQPTLGTHRLPDQQEVIEQQQVRPPRLPAVVQVELRHLPDRSPGNQGEQSNQQAHGIQVKRLQPGGKEPGERK